MRKVKVSTRLFLIILCVFIGIATGALFSACNHEESTFSITSVMGKDSFILSWTGAYDEVRLRGLSGEEDIMIQAGATSVELSFTGTNYYSFEYNKGGKWQELKKIVFYNKNKVDYSTIKGEAVGNKTTLSWKKKDNIDTAKYEVYYCAKNEEPFVTTVSGAQATLELDSRKTYSVMVRPITDPLESDGDLELSYSYWSEAITVARLGEVGIEYKDSDGKIYLKNVKNATSYNVIAYYDKVDEPFYNKNGRIELVADEDVAAVEFDTSEIKKSFTLSVMPIGASDVSVDKRLFVSPENRTEQKITLCSGVEAVEIKKDVFVWNEVENCNYLIKKTTQRGESLIDEYDMVSGDNQLSYGNFGDVSALNLAVKPIYYHTNTFSPWSVSGWTNIVNAPELRLIRNGNNIMITWNVNSAMESPQYSVAVFDGEEVIRQSTSLSFSYSLSDFTKPGIYDIEVCCVAPNTIGRVASTKVEKLACPEIAYERVAAEGGEKDYVKISIVDRDAAKSYSFKTDYLNASWVDNDIIVYNSKDYSPERLMTLSVFASAAAGVNNQFDSSPKVLTIAKRKNISSANVSVDANGLSWSLEQGENFRYALTNTDVGTQWQGTVIGTALPFSTVLGKNERLKSGNYRVDLYYYASAEGEIISLDGEVSTYRFAKAAPPTDAVCAESVLSWAVNNSGTVSIASYSLTYGAHTRNTVNNSIDLSNYSEEFNTGENNLVIVALGSKNSGITILNSDPLVYTVNKLAVPDEAKIKDNKLIFSSVTNALAYRINLAFPADTHPDETFTYIPTANGDSYSFSLQDFVDKNGINYLSVAGEYIVKVKAVGNGNSLFNSNNTVPVKFYKLATPQLSMVNQYISVGYSVTGEEPTNLSCTIDSVSSILAGSLNSINPQMNGLLSHGEHAVTVMALGNGEKTINSEQSERYIFYKQAVPMISFSKVMDTYRIICRFAENNSGEYIFALDKGNELTAAITADTYIIPSTLLEGKHSYASYLAGNDKKNLLASEKSELQFVKLCKPRLYMTDAFSVNWNVNDPNNADKYTLYDLNLTIDGSNLELNGYSQTSYNNFSTLYNGKGGSIFLKALGSVDALAVDSEYSEVFTFSRADVPGISFGNQQVFWTASHDSTYAVTVNGQFAFDTKDAVITSNYFAAAGNYTISIIQKGSAANGRLPSFSSNQLEVSKLAAPILGYANGVVTYSGITNARAYHVAMQNTQNNNEVYSGDISDLSYAVDAEGLLPAGNYVVKVSALAINGNYIHSDISQVMFSKLSTPVIAEVDYSSKTLRWKPIAGAKEYAYTVDGNLSTTVNNELTLSDNDFCDVTLQAIPLSANALKSDKLCFGVDVAATPYNLSFDFEKSEFCFSASQDALCTVSLNNGVLAKGVKKSIKITGLAEGENVLSVKRNGYYENFVYYFDSEAVTLIVNKLSAPTAVIENDKLIISSSAELFEYSIDGGARIVLDTKTLSLSDLSIGKHKIEIYAVRINYVTSSPCCVEYTKEQNVQE